MVLASKGTCLAVASRTLAFALALKMLASNLSLSTNDCILQDEADLETSYWDNCNVRHQYHGHQAPTDDYSLTVTAAPQAILPAACYCFAHVDHHFDYHGTTGHRAHVSDDRAAGDVIRSRDGADDDVMAGDVMKSRGVDDVTPSGKEKQIGAETETL